MSTLTLTLTPTIFRRLQERAERAGRPPAKVAEELLAEQLASPAGEQARLDEVIQAMYAKGDLVAMSTDLAYWADDLRRSLGDEVEFQALRSEMEETVLDPPLSQAILEMRGPQP